MALEDMKEDAIKSFCETWRFLNRCNVYITDARSGEILALDDISFEDKDEMLPEEEEEEDPALYEFEPGRVYWNQMAANP